MKSLADPTLLRRWLRKRVALQIAESLLISVAALCGGAVALAFTFVLSSAILGGVLLGISGFRDLYFNKPLHVPFDYVLIGSSIFLVLLFIENFRTRREYLGYYGLQSRAGPVTGLWSAVTSLLAAPDATGRVTADLLFLGPRLTSWSVLYLFRIVYLLRINVPAVSGVLAVLARQRHRTSFVELTKLLLGRDPMLALMQLQEIDCVLFLVREPAGVTLAPETREELDKLMGLRGSYGRGFYEYRPPKEEPAAPPPPPVDEDAGYYELLGIKPPASFAEVKSAYRKRIKQCHPDKFAGRGEDFRKLAEERAKTLNEAYRILSEKHGKDLTRV